jgi:hypothetical protein
MKYLIVTIAPTIAFCLTASVALAAQPPSQAVLNKKQLIGCMTKEMSASRTISYNEATKVCKALIKSQSDTLVASNATKAETAR